MNGIIPSRPSNLPWREELLREGATVLRGRLGASLLDPLDRVTREMIARWSEGLVRDADYWACPGPNEAPVLYRIHHFETKWDGALPLMRSAPVQEILHDLFGGPAHPTELAITLKLAKVGAAVGWHRDPVESPPGRIFNLSFYLDDSSSENGCLEFVPGSHRQPRVPIAGEPAGRVPVPVARGDIIIHDVNVIHGSGANLSSSMRRALVVEFRRSDVDRSLAT